MFQATNLPADIDVDAIAEAACQAAFKTIADAFALEGYPVTGDFFPSEVAAMDATFRMYVRAMAMNNDRISEMNPDA